MFERQKQAGLWLMVLISAIIFTTTAGCKEEKEGAKQQPAEQTQTEHNNEQSQSERLTKNADEAVKTATELAAGAKVSLDDIIKAAKSWGPGYTSWYGKTAPNFTLTDTVGKQHKLSDYRGRNVLLTFWATWCPACNKEIPHLIALRNTIGEDKLAMLAASNEDPALVKKFIAEKKINYTILLDKGNMPKPFGVKRIYGTTGIPCSFFIDAEGKIKLAAVGVVPLSEIKAILQAK